MKLILGILTLITGITITVVLVVLNITFDRNCEGHLKRAADANTIKMASGELHAAVAYMEREGLTQGYTSIIYTTPDEDVGFWYNNIKSAMQQLDSIPSTATDLEKSNMLMKLRETLLDQGESSLSITCPMGISRFPNNTAWGITVLIWAIATCALVGAILIDGDL